MRRKAKSVALFGGTGTKTARLERERMATLPENTTRSWGAGQTGLSSSRGRYSLERAKKPRDPRRICRTPTWRLSRHTTQTTLKCSRSTSPDRRQCTPHRTPGDREVWGSTPGRPVTSPRKRRRTKWSCGSHGQRRTRCMTEHTHDRGGGQPLPPPPSRQEKPRRTRGPHKAPHARSGSWRRPTGWKEIGFMLHRNRTKGQSP